MTVNWKLLVAGIVALFLVVGSVGVLSGVDTPLQSTETHNPDQTSREASSSGGADSNSQGGDATSTPEPRPFDMNIDSVESCVQTCRDVTATIVNEQDRKATGVSVHTRIYAGSTPEGDPLLEATEEVGSLGPGATDTATRRIKLGFTDAAAIKGADGKITIVLIVETDRQSERFVEHRDVA